MRYHQGGMPGQAVRDSVWPFPWCQLCSRPRTLIDAVRYVRMPTLNEATRFIERAQGHIFELQARIRCHRELIATLEREGHEELLDEARAMLQQMLGWLHEMEGEYVSAQQQIMAQHLEE